jgi:hypothetical protein
MDQIIVVKHFWLTGRLLIFTPTKTVTYEFHDFEQSQRASFRFIITTGG